MLPGIDGFHWTFGHIFFVSVFLCILTAIGVVAATSFWRAGRDLRSGRAGKIRWSMEFGELPARDRACRHALTGEAPGRVCPNAFDCRECANHAKFRQSEVGGAGNVVFGMEYPAHRYYHRGHTWVEPQKDGTLLVGLDEIGRRTLGRPDSCVMPAAGTVVYSNGDGWRMSKDGLDVRVLSPVDGTVVETSSTDDWCLRVRPLSEKPDLRHLLRGEEVAAWVGREIERLQIAMSGSAAPALADGGVLVDEFIHELPPARRDAVVGEVFLEM